MMKSAIAFFMLFGFFVMGCSHPNCANQVRHRNTSSEDVLKLADEKNSQVPFHLRVRIYKPDGTLQCGQGKKLKIETVEAELKGITVFERAEKNDGMMRTQVCGSPTGNSLVFEIPKDKLSEALKKGFKQWTFDDGSN